MSRRPSMPPRRARRHLGRSAALVGLAAIALLVPPTGAAGQDDTSADLTLGKTDSPDPATVGQPLTYTIAIGNGGPAAPDDVTVVDTLPSSVTFGSASSSRGTCTESSGTVTCDLGTLESGANVTITIQVTPNQAGPIDNTARVSGSGHREIDEENNQDVETTVVEAAQDGDGDGDDGDGDGDAGAADDDAGAAAGDDAGAAAGEAGEVGDVELAATGLPLIPIAAGGLLLLLGAALTRRRR